MLFVSYTFLFFFPVVAAARWLLPRRAVAPLLLAASYVFYMSWGPAYGALLAGATGLSYLVARGMERWPHRRKGLLALGVVGCLGALAYFKYAGFLVTQGYNLVALLGHAGPVPALDIVLPLGISFYLFQVLSYLVDVYRGAAAERSVLHHALYVSFFPQLVAGPIVRARELVPQLRSPARFDADAFAEGLFLALRGFVKKAVLADTLALWSDRIYGDHAAASTLGLWVGVLAYTAQIYCDFSGYTDIARGSARMLGFSIPENFDLPYVARSPAEFWRRWHMTLSRWLRDYLYIPLGGNRRGSGRTYANLLGTMALGGLWHGAHWRFVAWGVYHGLLLAGHRAWLAVTGDSPRLGALRKRLPYRAAALLFTLFGVTIGWIFFRAASLGDALAIIGGLFGHRPHTGEIHGDMLAAIGIIGVVAVTHALGATRVLDKGYGALPSPVRGVAWASMIGVIYLFAQSTDVFIYFQF